MLGFDQSTTVSGWCIFEDNRYIDSGVLDLSFMKKDSTRRMLAMAEQICQRIDEVLPDKVVIEDIFENKNVTTLVILGRLQGVIMHHCYKKGIPIEILASKTWRRLVGIKQIKRDDCKQAAIRLVKEKYGLDITSDEAEAVCITSTIML